MYDHKHPIWPIIRMTVLMTALTAILYLTAQSFDESELKTLLGFFLTAAGLEGVGAAINRFNNKSE